jgi:hypothetical protein
MSVKVIRSTNTKGLEDQLTALYDEGYRVVQMTAYPFLIQGITNHRIIAILEKQQPKVNTGAR